MKKQENLEIALALIKETVDTMRPFSLGGDSIERQLFYQCLDCELSIHRYMVQNLYKMDS
ncbi:hypothetical protein A6F57_19710 [Alteromonas stellipolaris]|nr:hypothetical protein A6F57_19710 [Alteromonas stellipolaris]